MMQRKNVNMPGQLRGSIHAGILAGAALVMALAGSASVARAADAPAFDAEKFLVDKAPALVTVKFNLRAGTSEDDEASESEITGVMIEPNGLVLCSNIQLTGASMVTAGRNRTAATPTNIRVMAGDDTQGVKAKLLARDKELDLAWIQTNDPPEKPFDFIDLTKAEKPRIGQRVVSVRRMGKYFDRVPALREAQIGAFIKKPRDLYVFGASGNGDFGLPVFAIGGQILGFIIMPISDANEELGSNPYNMLGGVSGVRDILGGVVLPAEEVAKATKRAKEHPQTQPADDDKATTKPADDDAKDKDAKEKSEK